MPLGDDKTRRRPTPLASSTSTSFGPVVAATVSTPPITPTGRGYPAIGQAQCTASLGALASSAPATFSPAASFFESDVNVNVERTDFAASAALAAQTPRPHYLAGEEWAAAISRYGLTSSSLTPRDQSAASPDSHPITARPVSIASTTSAEDTHTHRPGTLLSSKRHSDDEASRGGIKASPLKKARTRLLPPGGIDLAGVPRGNTTAAAVALYKSQGVTSPLFFSNSSRNMSRRAPRLPPSDAAAALLARLREDGETTHTVKLPRGNVHAASPARSGSTSAGSGSWSSVEPAASSTRSPNSTSLPPGLQVLQGVGVIELLEQDERPTFIIDLLNPINANKPGLHLMYANAALRASSGTLKLLAVEGDQAARDVEYSNFKSWLLSCVKNNESMNVCLPSHAYGGITWTCSTLRRRFRFISASASAVSVGSPEAPEALAKEAVVLEERSRGPTPSPHQSEPPVEIIDEPDYFGEVDVRSAKGLALQFEDAVMEVEVEDDGEERHHSDEFTNHVFHAGMLRPSFDWTRINVTPEMNSHIAFARSIDWAATGLGPISEWSADLRAMANMVMGSPHPAAMYWGPDYVTIYNEAYVEIAGKKHPSLMGMRYEDAWSEIWDDLRPVLNGAYENGQSTLRNDNRLFVYRHGFLEETFFSWSIVPLIGSDGQVVGLYNPAFENTRRKVNERRMLTLREVGEKTAAARDVRGFWPKVKEGLEFNDVDIPFALIYSVKDDNESEISSMHSGSATHPPQLQLEGALGVEEGHPSAVMSLDLRTSDQGFAPYMRQSLTMHGAPIVLTAADGTLPGGLLEGMDWRGYGEASRTVIVLPVHPTTGGESVVGFIVMGTNPRRPYDDDYKLFIHLLSRQLATSLASVVLFEEEIKRGQRAAKLAALDREELRTELILRTQEAVESEYKFTRMAEFAPVGMFIASGAGFINFANDAWWQISRHPRGEDSADSWMQSVRDEDRAGVERVWHQLLVDKEAITHEFRFKSGRQNGNHFMDTWVLLSAYPEKDEDGHLKSIFGCITDISTQKWAEAFQNERREEAVELKRQQENFIDITSHEMRNPLSAILQCADEISHIIHDYRDQPDDQVTLLLDRCQEAANTINLCASHQHRIVDDILTLSKLDSQLLLVTPVQSRPVTIVQNVLKMFESEVHTHDIKLEFDIKPPYLEHALDWVTVDPSRLRQVLINLMTNAIKFTQNRDERRISVTLSASREISEVDEPLYFPSRRTDQHDLTDDKDWGTGDKMNLHFSVQDTGPGLRDEEKKLLFQRFSQASPRTHVQYGGSGLGLFISRMLTELQGGQIGVVSHEGRGSTFSFYVKCRKADAPSEETTSLADLKAQKPTRAGRVPTTTTPPPVKSDGSSTAPPTPSLAPPPPGHDVLIVEDNLVNQKVLQRQLKNCGNTTHVANHGGEAIDALKLSRFWSGHEADGYHLSVILMDLEMPVMDGMTCAKRIRELERDGVLISHIPIIAVTAYARPEQIEDAKAAGIDDVISKPFRIPDLTAKIDELISRYSKLSTSA